LFGNHGRKRCLQWDNVGRRRCYERIKNSDTAGCATAWHRLLRTLRMIIFRQFGADKSSVSLGLVDRDALPACFLGTRGDGCGLPASNAVACTIAIMRAGGTVLESLGGEEGCRRLSAAFYARVGKDPVLRPLFPGKSLKCAIQEFAAFLIQFLGGDEEQTHHRWWLSLRESHARFRIGPAERHAWLKQMEATLEATALDEATRNALCNFFSHSSAYVIGKDAGEPDHEELAARWSEQRVLDRVIATIVTGRDDETLALAPRFVSRPSVFVGLLARMVRSRRARLIQLVIDATEKNPSLATRRFAGGTLLHVAAGAGCLEVVTLLLRLGVDPNIQGRGRTPLYCVANECASETGPDVVRALVQAGADVNACAGVTRTTALHMAARRGRVEIARALLDAGAAVNARSRKGDTPLQRAINCRKNEVAQLLLQHGGAGQRAPR
jgi:hemoglobin